MIVDILSLVSKFILLTLPSAIFSSIYNDDAILTAVKTQPEFRRMGYASALVSYMIGDIKGSTYLMREMGKNEEFYKNLGFINIGKWRLYKWMNFSK